MAGVSVTIGTNTRALDRLGDKAKSAAATIKGAFMFRVGQKMFDGLAQAAAAASRAVVAYMKEAVEVASDFNETLGKTEQVFGENSTALLRWSANSARAFGQSQGQALAAASTFGNLFKAMGVTEEQSAAMSRRLVELASDLASFNNTSPEAAIEALGAGLRGEAEPLRKYGVLLDAATLKAEAMAQGLSDGKATLDPATRALAAYQVILTQTSTAQGDFERTADGLANSQRTIAAQLEDAKTQIGEGLLPVVLKLAEAIKEVDMQALADVPVGAIEKAKGALEGLAATTPGLAALVSTLGANFKADELAGVIDQMNAGRSRIDSREVAKRVTSREEIEKEAREAEQVIRVYSDRIRGLIERMADDAQRSTAGDMLQGNIARMQAQVVAIRSITDETLAANAASREAAAARTREAEALAELEKRLPAVQKAYQAAVDAAEKTRQSRLPIEDQLAALEEAERRLRRRIAVPELRGRRAQDLGEMVKSRPAYAEQDRDLDLVRQILELEQARAAIHREIAEQDARREDAISEYESELALLRAQADGNRELVTSLEREAEIRREIASLTQQGVEAEEARRRATELVDAQRAVAMADLERGAVDALAEARALVGGADDAEIRRQQRQRELEAQGLDPERAAAVADNEASLEAIRSLRAQQDSLGFQSTLGAVSSMQRIGGGGGAVSSGLDYQRQAVDLQRQMVALLGQMTSRMPREPIEY